MAINLDHTPISTAGRLGQRAGEGDDFRWRFGAGQQLINSAVQRQQYGDSSRAREIQLAMAQQQQQFSQNRADRADSRADVQGQAAASSDARRQKLQEDRFQFEKDKFAEQRPAREAESQAKLQKLQRESSLQDPTKLPAFRAMDELLAPYQRQMEKLENEMQKAQTGVSFADPKMIEAQMQQLQAMPIKLPGGESIPVGELFNMKDSFLAQALPMFEAAKQADEVAREKALTEARIDDTVDELSNTLQPGTPTPQIAQQVINKLGPAGSPEEAMVIAEAVNEIEQNIRKQAGHAFPNITGGP